MFNYCTPVTLPDLVSETRSDGSRVYVTPEGESFSSVTTVVGHHKKKVIAEWRNKVGHETANKISAQSSKRGTGVHTLCERYLMNEKTIGKGVMPDALEMFRSIQPHLNKINNIHYLEQALWSKQLQLAGRVDCIAEYEGLLSIIDFKTSRKIKTLEQITDYFWQTTSYALMYEELVGQPIDNLVIIMAVEHEQPLIFQQKTENHIEGLVKVIHDYRTETNRIQRKN